MDRALVVEKLKVRYTGSPDAALDLVSFEVAAGGSLAVLGPSGAGKTTLFNALTGLLQAQEAARVDGTITIKRHAHHTRDPWITFPDVSMVPQDSRQVLSGFVPNVRSECELTLRQSSVEETLWPDTVRRIAKSLEISHLLERDPRTLSGGETQSVALAIMSVAEPSILLLDEPASSLDQDRMDALTRFFLRRPSSLTIILADTALHAGVLACERIMILDHGRVAYHGTREEFWLRLPEFQDLVSLGGWTDIRRTHRNPDAAAFLAALEESC